MLKNFTICSNTLQHLLSAR